MTRCHRCTVLSASFGAAGRWFPVLLLLSVILSLSIGVLPAQAFDGSLYYKDAYYGTRPFFSVVTPTFGLRWEYLPGLKGRETVYPVYGYEHFLKLEDPSRNDYLFLKSALLLSGLWKPEVRVGVHTESVMIQSGLAVLLGYSWTLKRTLPYVDMISPCIALGPSYEISQSTLFLRNGPASGPQGVISQTFAVAYQAGVEFTFVRHLFGIKLQMDGFTGLRLTDSGFLAVRNAASGLTFSTGFVFYNRVLSNE